MKKIFVSIILVCIKVQLLMGEHVVVVVVVVVVV